MQPQWDFSGEIVWRPTPEQAARSRMAAFMRAHGITTFEELMRRSTEDPGGPGARGGIDWFWDAVIRDLDIRFSKPYDKILDTSQGEPWARRCVGGELNIVSSCLD